MEDTIKIDRAELMELRMLEQTVRATRAECLITQTQAASAEGALKTFAEALGAKLTEGGVYELGQINGETGEVPRKLTEKGEALKKAAAEAARLAKAQRSIREMPARDPAAG